MCGKNNLIDIKKQFDTLAKYQPYFKDHCCTTNFAMFNQTWGSTALGFNGIGGSAMTDALTIAIPRDGKIDVFFGGMYAYTVPEKDATPEHMIEFKNDFNVRYCAADVDRAKDKYGAYIDEYVAGCYPSRVR